MLKKTVHYVVNSASLSWNLSIGVAESNLIRFIDKDSIWIPLAKRASKHIKKALEIGHGSLRLLSDEKYEELNNKMINIDNDIDLFNSVRK